MGRKLTDATRSKALLNDAWDTIKLRSEPPKWNYIATVAIVDRMLEAEPGIDGREISDALVLCAEMGEAPTVANIRSNMNRISRGRLGTGGWK